MNGLNVFSPRPPEGPYQSDPQDGWALPIGRIKGVHLYVAYSVFVALAVLAGLVAMIQNRPGNTDLPETALLAVGIWALGWLIQLSVYLFYHFAIGYRSSTITIGLLGVESPNRLWDGEPWTGGTTITVVSSALLGVFLCGGVFFLAHAMVQSTWSADAIWELLRTPGFGLGGRDRILLAGTWLCWVQVLCQLFPLPRNLGRSLLCAVASIYSPNGDDEIRLQHIRRVLRLTAIVTLILAMLTMMVDQDGSVPRWPILALLAVLLWISCRNADLRDAIIAHRLAIDGDSLTGFDDEPDVEPVPGWATQLTESIRMRKKRQKAKIAMQREREEADDVARLDDVLKMVSEKGTDGLSDQDRALLKRVSQSLRQQRESEAEDTDVNDDPSETE